MQDDSPQPLSKTKRKQQMHGLQKLGERLVALNPAQLAQLPLPEALRDAVLEAKRIKGFGALSRQMQYIGRLMRDVDAEPIRSKFDEWDGNSRAETARHHSIERWRERLLAEETALSELLATHPGADGQRLRTLIRNAQRELAAGKPPKSSRELFRELRELIETTDRPAETPGEAHE